MPRALQIRDVPDDVHRRLKVRAASEGRTLSDLLRAELADVARRPTMAEMIERLKSREPAPAGESPADSVRAGRDERWSS